MSTHNKNDICKNREIKKKKEYHPRYKLNMLEPGIWFCKVYAILILLGIILYFLHFITIFYILITGMILGLVIFFILLFIEQKQDERLYEQAKAKDKDIK